MVLPLLGPMPRSVGPIGLAVLARTLRVALLGSAVVARVLATSQGLPILEVALTFAIEATAFFPLVPVGMPRASSRRSPTTTCVHTCGALRPPKGTRGPRTLARRRHAQGPHG